MKEILIANQKGHETQVLSDEEAQNLVDAECGRYFVVDPETNQVLRGVDVREHEKLMLIPMAGGG